MKSNASILHNSAKLTWFVNQINRLQQYCFESWNTLAHSPITNREPQVNWKRDRQGNAYLEIFDPITEMHWYFQSEQEARAWLNQHYNIR